MKLKFDPIFDLQELFVEFDSINEDYYDEKISFPAIPKEGSKLPPIKDSVFINDICKIDSFHFPENINNIITEIIKIARGHKDMEARVSLIRRFPEYFMERSEKTAKTNLVTIAFTLILMDKLEIYGEIFYDKYFNGRNHIGELFNTNIFPDDPTDETSKFGYIMKVDYILYKWATKTSEEGQNFLFNKIYEYAYEQGKFERRIYNFLPFFLHLAKNQDNYNVFKHFLTTKLFTRILTDSTEDLILFDIVRYLLEQIPFESYLYNDSLQEQIPKLYSKENYREAVSNVLSVYLTKINEAEQTTSIVETEKRTPIEIDKMIVIRIIRDIITSCKAEDGKQKEILNLYPTLIQCFPQVSKHLFERIIEINIFEDLASISIYSRELFQSYLELLTGMYSRFYDFGYRISSRKYEIYNILEGYEADLPDIKYFENLSFCSESGSIKNKYLRNYKGVELVIALSSLLGSQEKQFSDFLTELSSNSGNLLELSHAKVPEFVLKRLTEIKHGEEEELVHNYLEMFKNISMVVFNNSLFYRTIETLGQEGFEYRNEIIDIIKELLKKNKHNKKIQQQEENDEPTSFFRLDSNLGCGIFYPNMWKDQMKTFSISFFIRVNEINNDAEQGQKKTPSFPLLSIQSTSSRVKIGLEIKQGEVCLKEFDGNQKESNHSFGIQIEQGQWKFFQIFFNSNRWPRKDTIEILYDKTRLTSKLSNSIPRDGTILIGTESQEDNSLSLACDLSRIVILEGDDQTNGKLILHIKEQNTNDKIRSMLDPTNGHEGICFDKYNNEVTKYRGIPVPFVPNIYEVFQTIGCVTNILPLFNMKEKEKEKTTEFYISIIQVFKEMVHLTEQVKEIFLESRLFELLLSFLLEVDIEYLTIGFVQELFNLYHELYPIEELRYQMAQYIILNYNFIMNLNDDVTNETINKLIPTIIKDNKTESYHYSYLPTFIYQTYQYFSLKPIGKNSIALSNTAWSNLTTMIEHNLRYIKAAFEEKIHKNLANKYIMTVFRFMMNLETDYSIIKSLEVINQLIEDGYYEEVKNSLSQEAVIEQFIELMGQKSSTIQIKTLEIIHKLKKDINLHKTIYQCACEFVGRPSVSEKLINKIFGLLIVEEDGSNKFIEFNADYLPLLTICSNIYASPEAEHDEEPYDKNLIKRLCDKLTNFIPVHENEAQSFYSVPCWFDLLRDFYRIVYDPETDQQLFAAPFSHLFAKEFRNCNVEPINNFFYSFDYCGIISTRIVKRFILSNLINGDKITQRQILTILPVVFDHLIFERTTAHDEESACTIKLREINHETVEKEDVELAQKLIFITLGDKKNLSTKTTTIGFVLEMNVLVAISILASNFLRFDTKVYAEVILKIKEFFSENDSELNFRCASILVEPFEGLEIEDDEADLREAIESLRPYLLIKGKRAKFNVIAKEKDKVIESIIKNFLAMQGSFLINAQKIIDERFTDRDKNSKAEEYVDEEQMKEEEGELISMFLTSSFTKSKIVGDGTKRVRLEDRKFRLLRVKKARAEIKRIAKLKASFLQSLSKIPGPWLNKEDLEAKYKAFNFISKKGHRIVLKINNQFDSHKDASENTKKNQGNKQEEEKKQAEVINEFAIPRNVTTETDEIYLEVDQFNVNLEKIAERYSGSLKFTSASLQFVSTDRQKSKSDNENNNNNNVKKFIMSKLTKSLNDSLNDSSIEGLEDQTEPAPTKKVKIDFKNISFILDRRVFREEKACEIFLNNYKSYFFIFSDNKERNRFYAEIDRIMTPRQETIGSTRNRMNKFDIFASLRSKCNSFHQTMASSQLVAELNLSTLWQTHRLTNYEYIYYLNILGGRSFNYVNQYPIFPYLIKGCKSDEFKLNDESMYRNLEYPLIKLNMISYQRKIKQFLFYLEETQENYILVDELPFKSSYVGKVAGRTEPFTTLQINNNSNKIVTKFDEANSQFCSIPSLMYDVIFDDDSLENLFETIPEMFTFPVMMINENKFDFGERTKDPKGPVGNVILPPWCQFEEKEGTQNEVKNSELLKSFIFTNVSRIALESEYVSKNLHKWIDLYFTEGREKTCMNDIDHQFEDIRKYTMYRPYSYPEIENVENYKTNDEHQGMLPEVLFTEPHKEKEPYKPRSDEAFPAVRSKIVSIIKEVAFCQGSSMIDIGSGQGETSVEVPETIGDLECVIRGSTGGNNAENYCIAVLCTKSNPFVTVVNLKGNRSLRAECHVASTITSVSSIGDRFIITGCSDCSVSLWEVKFLKRENESIDNFRIKHVSSTSYHSGEVIAVGGCYENGLVVSLGINNILIFETILNHKFINFVDLNSNEFSTSGRKEEAYTKTHIRVFKSGLVSVSQKTRVILFDHRGKALYIWKPKGCEEITETKKFYDIDTREFLIVGYRTEQLKLIDIFDLTTFKLACPTKVLPHDHLCPMKKSRKIVLSIQNILSEVDFAPSQTINQNHNTD